MHEIHLLRSIWLRMIPVIATGMCCLLGGCQPAGSGPTSEQPTSWLSDDQLRQQVDEVLDFTFNQRHLSTSDQAAWQVMHGVVAYGRRFPVRHDGQLVPALDYLLDGGYMTGWNLVPGDIDAATGHRGVRAIVEAGSKTGQGHVDQWLGYMSQCQLSPQRKIVIRGEEFTLADLIHQAEWDVPRNVDQEFSWTLMGLSSYRPSTHTWPASDGKTWSIEQLVEIEVNHGLQGACGGSHRLGGLCMALNAHLAQGGKMEGVWKKADDRIKEAIEVVRKYQNPDGSFSSNYFLRPGASPDLADALSTTGHTLEFLALGMTDEELRQDWVRRGVVHLCDMFRRTKDLPLECGGLYHSVHGLILYRERMFGPGIYSTPPVEVAPEQTTAATDSPASPSVDDLPPTLPKAESSNRATEGAEIPEGEPATAP